MRKLLTAAFAAASLFAGSFSVDMQPGDSQRSVQARITACTSPEKATITATAEHGTKVIPLQVKGLEVQVPREGDWTVKVIATNPEYRDYTAKAQIQVRDGAPDWSTAKRF